MSFMRYLLLSGLVLFSSFAWADQSLNSIAAIVNDQVITTAELQQQVQVFKQQAQGANVAIPSADVMRKQVLNHMIDDALQMQVAKKAGITITDQQLNAAIANIASQNQMTTAVLYQQVAAHGMTVDSYRAEIRHEMLISAVQQKSIGPTIQLSPQEVNTLYNQIKAKAQAQNHTPPTLDQIKQMVFRQKFNEALQTWLQNLRSQSYVKILAN